MTDFQTWLLDEGYDRLFRIREYLRPDDWTSVKNIMYRFVIIREAIELPNNDILLGLQFVDNYEDMNAENYPIEYRRLSRLQLSYYPEDSLEENWKKN